MLLVLPVSLDVGICVRYPNLPMFFATPKFRLESRPKHRNIEVPDLGFLIIENEPNSVGLVHSRRCVNVI